MSYFVNVRRFIRPDQPQPVYKGALNLWEAPLYAAIGDAQRNTSVRPAERLPFDLTRPDWDGLPGWYFTNLPSGPTTAQTWPAIALGLATSTRTLDGAALDVRRSEWAPAFGLPVPDATVAQQLAAWASSLSSTRSADRAPLLDLLRGDWDPAFTWNQSVVDTTTRTWAPIFSAQLKGERSVARPSLDVRGSEWSPAFSWAPKAVDTIVGTWAGIWPAQLRSDRSPDGPRLDLFRPDWDGLPGWIFTNLPGALTAAQIWPALLLGLAAGYRSGDRAGVDVLRPATSSFTGLQRVVESVLATWSPIWQQQAGTARSPEGPRLEVRLSEWLPSLGWLFLNLPGVTAAQLWPAIALSLAAGYRSADRGVLDVRAHAWRTSPDWLPKAVDTVVSQWAPVFSAEANSLRSVAGPSLELRGPIWLPEDGWRPHVVDGVVALWIPAITAVPSFRSAIAPPFDVRSVTWTPELAWYVAVIAFLAATADVIVRAAADDVVVLAPGDDGVVLGPADDGVFLA